MADTSAAAADVPPKSSVEKPSATKQQQQQPDGRKAPKPTKVPPPATGRPQRSSGMPGFYLYLVSFAVVLLSIVMWAADGDGTIEYIFMLGRRTYKMTTNNAKSTTVQAPPKQPRPTPSADSGSNAYTKPTTEPSPALLTLTLEEYSDRFIATEREKENGKHFFCCGTRVTQVPASAESNAEKTLFPTLRAVLRSKREVEEHEKQRWNVATQRIALERFGDDYCDCDDGTDELTTNACSMNGIVTPLSRGRLMQRRAGLSDSKLYDDDLLNGNPPRGKVGVSKSAKGALTVAWGEDYKHLTQPQRDALKALQEQRVRLPGPVLPFACAGDPTTLLSPSHVNDGVVDCCDGSDEAEEAVRTAAQERQRQFWESLHVNGNDAKSFVSQLRNSSADKEWAKLISEMELYSLLGCAALMEVRVLIATHNYNMVKKGHAVFLERVENAWDQFGDQYTRNSTELRLKVNQIEEDLKTWYSNITSRMQIVNARTPEEAGVSTEEIREFENLSTKHREVQMEARHSTLMQMFHVLGNEFEYYPLVKHDFPFPTSAVVSSSFHSIPKALRSDAMDITYVSKSEFDLRTLEKLPIASLTVVPFMFAGALVPVKVKTKARAAMMENPLVEVQDDAEGEYAHSEQFVALGNWNPNPEETFTKMPMVDPAGDTYLPRILFMEDSHPIRGGYGQQLARVEKRPKLMNKGGKSGKDALDELRKKSKEDEGDEDEDAGFAIPFSHTTPYTPSVHIYRTGMTCEPEQRIIDRVTKAHNKSMAEWRQKQSEREAKAKRDRRRKSVPPLQSEEQFSEEELRRIHQKVWESRATSEVRLVFVCRKRDQVLKWYRNGLCLHEIIFGTPSACTKWTLREAENRLNMAKSMMQEPSG